MSYHFAFPFSINSYTKQVETVDDKRFLQDSIYFILMTHVKERWMLPAFGSRVHDYVFETMDSMMLEQLKKEMIDSLQRWGFCFQDLHIAFHLDDNRLFIELSYVVEQELLKTKFTLEMSS